MGLEGHAANVLERAQATGREVSFDELPIEGTRHEWANSYDLLFTAAAESIDAMLTQQDTLQALQRLPPRQRQVFAYTVQGYTPAEIARRLGVTSETIRSSLKKARSTLAPLVPQILGTA
ncbi:sigma-70 family RNA polymerase sigma factor [Nocardia sp. NPDC049190]|uniref:RNA polymerase sigma factor n=1 Tax=Nocardia sp. NPDC049190 TaxID=3155650 RepID=UPI003411BAAF